MIVRPSAIQTGLSEAREACARACVRMRACNTLPFQCQVVTKREAIYSKRAHPVNV